MHIQTHATAHLHTQLKIESFIDKDFCFEECPEVLDNLEFEREVSVQFMLIKTSHILFSVNN